MLPATLASLVAESAGASHDSQGRAPADDMQVTSDTVCERGDAAADAATGPTSATESALVESTALVPQASASATTLAACVSLPQTHSDVSSLDSALLHLAGAALNILETELSQATLSSMQSAAETDADRQQQGIQELLIDGVHHVEAADMLAHDTYAYQAGNGQDYDHGDDDMPGSEDEVGADEQPYDVEVEAAGVVAAADSAVPLTPRTPVTPAGQVQFQGLVQATPTVQQHQAGSPSLNPAAGTPWSLVTMTDTPTPAPAANLGPGTALRALGHSLSATAASSDDDSFPILLQRWLTMTSPSLAPDQSDHYPVTALPTDAAHDGSTAAAVQDGSDNAMSDSSALADNVETTSSQQNEQDVVSRCVILYQPNKLVPTSAWQSRSRTHHQQTL